MSDYNEIFEGVNAEIEANQVVVDHIKEKVKAVDEAYRHCAKLISAVHTERPSEAKHIGANVLQAQQFHDLRSALRDLFEAVADKPYYKYNGLWSHGVQNSIYLVVLCTWLSTGQLARPEQVAEILQLTVEPADEASSMSAKFNFSLEDYLHATITMVNELSRLAVNSVTATAASNAQAPGSESYDLPVDIDRFLKQLQSGFMALNLKNDSLRRRSDSVKYDVKKVEEIVYDLALRGLITRNN